MHLNNRKVELDLFSNIQSFHLASRIFVNLNVKHLVNRTLLGELIMEAIEIYLECLTDKEMLLIFQVGKKMWSFIAAFPSNLTCFSVIQKNPNSLFWVISV